MKYITYKNMDELTVRYEYLLFKGIKKFNFSKTLILYLFSFLEYPLLDNHSEGMTSLTITTATMAYNSTLSIDYKVLSNSIKKCEGLILAIKSSEIALEECLKNEYTKARVMLQKQKKRNKKHASVSHKSRRVGQGNGLYFQSSVEYVVGTKEKQYNVRISPKGGSIQIQGLNSPVYENSEYYVNYVLKYISKNLNIPDIKTFDRRFIIINAKTLFIHKSSHIKLTKLTEITRNIAMGHISNITPPYPIVFATHTHEVESFIMIKFATPINSDSNSNTKKNAERMTSVKIFAKKKLNILGAPSIVIILRIYKFLSMLLSTYESSIMVSIPSSKENNDTLFKWTDLI